MSGLYFAGGDSVIGIMFKCKREPCGANANAVSGIQFCPPLYEAVVVHGAIGAFLIFDIVIVVLTVNHCVLSGNQDILKDDVAGRGSADYGCRSVQAEMLIRKYIYQYCQCIVAHYDHPVSGAAW